MESGGEYTYAYSLLTPWSRMHSFEEEREGGRATTAAQCREQRKEGRCARCGSADKGSCWECRQAAQWGQMELMDLAR